MQSYVCTLINVTVYANTLLVHACQYFEKYREQFTRTLEQFTRARIELLVASVLLPARNSRKIIR